MLGVVNQLPAKSVFAPCHPFSFILFFINSAKAKNIRPGPTNYVSAIYFFYYKLVHFGPCRNSKL